MFICLSHGSGIYECKTVRQATRFLQYTTNAILLNSMCSKLWLNATNIYSYLGIEKRATYGATRVLTNRNLYCLLRATLTAAYITYMRHPSIRYDSDRACLRSKICFHLLYVLVKFFFSLFCRRISVQLKIRWFWQSMRFFPVFYAWFPYCAAYNFRMGECTYTLRLSDVCVCVRNRTPYSLTLTCTRPTT